MSFLLEALIFLGAALVVVPICQRLGMSVVLGYLIAGLVIGPYGLGVGGSREAAAEVMHFAEIGVVLLLFVIGLELQPKRLWIMRRLVFGLGSAQVVLTTIVFTAGFRFLMDFAVPTALLLGFALALSSTAFVLQLLAERGALNHAHGRAAFGTLLLQDVAVIPGIAVLALLEPGGPAMSPAEDALLIGLVVVGFLLARLVLRPFLRFIAGTGIHELFTAASLVLVVGAALTMEAIGLSMGLGAFIAGMMVADSEYRHQLETDVAPFKGMLLGLFFMAVGMSTDLSLLLNSPLLIIGLTTALMAVKTLVLLPLTRLVGLDAREGLRTAAVLSQGGEFGFVLLTAGVAAGVTDAPTVDLAVLVITLSMMLTPFYTGLVERALKPRSKPEPFDEIDEPPTPVVIAGFGRMGQIIGRILTMRHIPFTALENRSSQVEFVRQFGNRIYFGDPTNFKLLRSAHIELARALIITVDDAEAAVKMTEEVRTHYPNVKIFARARNRQHELRLRASGAHYVIRETLGSSLMMGGEVLVHLGLSEDAARHAIEVFRAHDEKTLEQQLAVFHDDDAFRAVAISAAQELETLFESDWEASAADSRSSGERASSESSDSASSSGRTS